MVSLEGKRVVVVGLGASGVAAAGATLAVGGHDRAGLTEADLIVVSPGVPSFAALEEAERQGIKIWGEVELATQALLHAAGEVAVLLIVRFLDKLVVVQVMIASPLPPPPPAVPPEPPPLAPYPTIRVTELPGVSVAVV